MLLVLPRGGKLLPLIKKVAVALLYDYEREGKNRRRALNIDECRQMFHGLVKENLKKGSLMEALFTRRVGL